ncbi:MAG: sigma-54-dependent transcriptional regulator [Planctomycetota bacterium]|jgi:two-component system nitrogen regulation response regulator GlnG
MAKVLIIDDEQAICWALRRILEKDGHEVAAEGTAGKGLARAEEDPPDVILLDVRLPDRDGLEALEAIRTGDLAGEVIVITAHGTMETAVEAIHRGAFDYLVKPLDGEATRLAVQRAARVRALAEEVKGLKARLRDREATLLVGATPAMQEVFKRIGMVSLSDASVLILGETGTGKDLAARAIHLSSPRKAGSFVPVHCAAIPETLLESELFGFEMGAFTGASRSSPGRMMRADGGTLFLDEVREIPSAIQVKLLRVLEEKTVEGLGASAPRPLDVRIIAATNTDLGAEVEAGRFREDLYFRLNVFTLRMPPLRERRDDIPLLVDHFLEAAGSGRPPISREAIDFLTALHWPGNVRELRNAVEHAAVLARGRPILPEDFPGELRGGGREEGEAAGMVAGAVAKALAEGKTGLHEAVLAQFEKPLLREIMRITGGNQVKAAELLGIHRTTLRRKLAHYGL